MDTRSLEFLNELILHHLALLRSTLPEGELGLGAETIRLVSRLLDRFESERAQMVSEMVSASKAERRLLGRGLERLYIDLKIFQPHLTPYVGDASRLGHSLGLMVTIESLVDKLLPDGADPVVHLDEHHQYATMDLARSLRTLWNHLPASESASEDLWECDSGPPVVFFVPDLDPDNTLFLPILAHEVGHQAVEIGRAACREGV